MNKAVKKKRKAMVAQNEGLSFFSHSNSEGNHRAGRPG